MDAIAEVYASIFGPDPIEYRAERGLLDVHEEMGDHDPGGRRHARRPLLPARVLRRGASATTSSAGRRASGARTACVRLVPGLGTRAVDRVGDDYPVLIAPGQPGLRVNVTPDEVVRYSPQQIDVINLETRTPSRPSTSGAACASAARDYPAIAPHRLGRRATTAIRRAGRARARLRSRTTLVVTFEGLIADTPFVAQMRALLELLRGDARHAGGHRVRLTTASDLYLLQCRPQSYARRRASPAPIPRDLPAEQRRLLRQPLRLERPGARHHPHRLRRSRALQPSCRTSSDLRDVGRAVGRLNKLLPKRQFILMGPGRWGSRGDIKLGVSVTYSDINNTAMLVEIARKRGQLRARPVLRHALLPGPGRGLDPLPAALPRRPGRRVQRAVLPRVARTSSPSCCPSSPTWRNACASSTCRRRPTGWSCGC